MAKKAEAIEPLTENKLKQAILDLQVLNEQYAALDKRYDDIAGKILATMPPKDVRQYGTLRCTIVQAFVRRVDWKKETFAMARELYSTKELFRGFLIHLVRAYKKKPNKPSVKLTIVQE